MPDWPQRSNVYIEGAIGKRAWPLVIVVSRWPIADRFGQVLVVPVVHDGLVIEQIHLRRTADHVQIDDLLRLGREVRATA